MGEIAPLAGEGQFVEHSFDLYKKDAAPEYLEMIENLFIIRRNDTFAELHLNGTLPESDSVSIFFHQRLQFYSEYVDVCCNRHLHG